MLQVSIVGVFDPIIYIQSSYECEEGLLIIFAKNTKLGGINNIIENRFKIQ